MQLKTALLSARGDTELLHLTVPLQHLRIRATVPRALLRATRRAARAAPAMSDTVTRDHAILRCIASPRSSESWSKELMSVALEEARAHAANAHPPVAG